MGVVFAGRNTTPFRIIRGDSSPQVNVDIDDALCSSSSEAGDWDAEAGRGFDI
jgi:hypothetical protein